MEDIISQLTEVHREVGTRQLPAGEGRTVVLRRRYPAPVEDVWDAITDPERISRWFLPVTGDLHLGGSYQLQGNARGEIQRCEPPSLLKVTWVYGEVTSDADISEVEVRLSKGSSSDTVLELEHAAVMDPEQWAEFGPGAAGVGWDLGLLGLGLHLRGESVGDPSEFETSPEAREFMTRSSQAWGAANEASGASHAEATRAAENTTKFYAPDPEPAPDSST